MEQEKWNEIKGFEGNYSVSSEGRVRSNGLLKGRNSKVRILKTELSSKGYLRVGLTKDGKQKKYLVHRLVAIAFLDNPNNLPDVNHKNECKTDNRLINLEWMSRKDNMNYGDRTKKAINTRFKNNIPLF